MTTASLHRARVPRIAITPGEPAGIGPDLCVMLAQRAHDAELVVIADPGLLMQRAAALCLPLEIIPYDGARAPQPHTARMLRVLAVAPRAPVHAGTLDRANAAYVLDSLRLAVEGCMRHNFDALVTGPVHKGVINEAGVEFTGHTEFLAELTRTPRVVMMLLTEGLRVALATTHLPLRAVADALTAPHLTDVLRILHGDLRTRFGIAAPRIVVCGLNPHAGEGGHLGTEDRDVVEPVLGALRAEGMDLVGPLPADTLFIPKYLDTADAVLAMYHDQGLPVLKFKGFGKAVNITLGLPIVRTSVDHGTALELAGKGGADIGSLVSAVQLACEIAART